MKKEKGGISPYTGTPLRRGSEIPYQSAKNVMLFMYNKHEYDNRIFSLRKSAFCRATGRIFPLCVTWYGVTKGGLDVSKKTLPWRLYILGQSYRFTARFNTRGTLFSRGFSDEDILPQSCPYGN